VTFGKGQLPPVKGFWSLTIYVQAAPPTDALQRANWLPAPRGDFSLYIRTYWPDAPIVNGQWTPPPVRSAKS
jgi:hypothetical protein